MKLKSPHFLAPMLEPNDIAFRLLCKKAGASLTFTGMTNPLSKKKQNLQDKPILQLFATTTKGIKQFMKKYDRKVSGWDFNLGCPSKLSRKLGHGAFLQKDLKQIQKIFREMRSSTKKICMVKLRKSPNAIKIARLAEKEGFDRVIIHPRTIQQGYSGEPDYKFALKLKKEVSLPIIYSGNVDEKNAKKILNDFQFIMIGRAAIGNPNIFAKLNDKKPKVNFKKYLKLAKKHKLFFRQIKYQAMNFTKGEKNAKELRRKLIGAKIIKDIERIYKIRIAPFAGARNKKNKKNSKA
jgi:tRNA-dihydrouridine synthase B